MENIFPGPRRVARTSQAPLALAKSAPSASPSGNSLSERPTAASEGCANNVRRCTECKAMHRMIIAAEVLFTVACFGCGNRSAPATHEDMKRAQVLPLTFGGFLKDGPEAERVRGVCVTDDTRILLSCDIYNGLPGWTLTEVTLAVTWSPYGDGDKGDYQIPTVIKPRTTEHVTVRLGIQLPPDSVFTLPHGKVTTHRGWAWLPVGAKGYLTR